jgi:predicted DsbA family dithiol-disulfide isomerase
MAAPAPISIDVVSDAVCPWCYVGQKRLDLAMATIPEIEASVRWRPFQLDPTIPPEGLDRKAYMEAKFGNSGRLEQAHNRLVDLGRDVGIDFAFGAIGRSPNTLDAHRVIRWAGSAGAGLQGKVVRRLFRAYFEEGRDIGRPEVLVELARDAGMDAALVETLLATDADRDAVREEIATASRMGVTGVPCFLLEGRYAVVGAQDTAVLADAIRRVAQAKAAGELETGVQ